MKAAEDERVRYERLQDIVRLAIRLQGSLGGLTLDDIRPTSPSAGGRPRGFGTPSRRSSGR